MGARWTPEDDVKLQVLWASPCTVASAMGDFPGRTEDALRAHAKALGLGDKTLGEAPTIGKIRDLMADKKARHVLEIAEEIGVVESGVREWISKLMAEEKIHIQSYDGPYRAAMYVLGAGDSAEKPAPLKQKDKSLGIRRQHEQANDEQVELLMDELYRDRDCTWWPKADMVVETAFHSMVRKAA